MVFDDAPVGTLTSVAGDIGLAVLKRAVEPGDRVRVGAATAVVRELPPKPFE